MKEETLKILKNPINAGLCINTKISTNNAVRIWDPTCNMRWRIVKIVQQFNVDIVEKVLEQEWRDNFGRKEWREIPSSQS
tara:strand:+ start:149 stop:388 length:240 start_codon:yes stop_codon:yes gene_type:complete